MDITHYREEEIKNTVTEYDTNQNPAYITINGKRFGLWQETIGYRDEQQTRPITRWFVQVSNDWNMSNRFEIESAQIRGLISKIEKHPYKLVK